MHRSFTRLRTTSTVWPQVQRRTQLGLPWVYEVRGVLEETWAAGGPLRPIAQARRASQRFALMRAKEIEVATAADAVITLGETMREHLIAGGVPAEKITLIPNSVSEAVVNADVSRTPAEVRAGLGLPKDGIWVGTAASIVGYEGLDDLVDAVILARAEGTDLRLLIAGDGVALPELRERAQLLGDNAVFTGRVSQVAGDRIPTGTGCHRRSSQGRAGVPLWSPRSNRSRRWGWHDRSSSPTCQHCANWCPKRQDCASPRRTLGLWQKCSRTWPAMTVREKRFGRNGRAHVLATRRWKEIGRRYGQVYSQLMGAMRDE